MYIVLKRIVSRDFRPLVFLNESIPPTAISNRASKLLKYSTFNVIPCSGQSAESAFALGPQLRIWLSPMGHCVSSGSGAHGHASTCICLCIHVHVTMCPFHVQVLVSIRRIWLFVNVLHRHRGGRISKINAWYLNTHMVYL